MLRANPYLRLLLGNARFRIFWSGEAVAFFANWFYYAALLGVVYSLFAGGDRELAASLALISAMIPNGLMVPLAGWIVDQFSRSRVLYFGKLVDMVLVLCLVFVHTRADVWVIYLINAVLGCSAAVFFSARKAIIPDLVSEEELYSANTLSNATRGTMMIVGALAGGVVTTELDPRTVFGLVAALHLVSGILFSRVHPRRHAERAPVDARPSILHEMKRGIGVIVGDTTVLWILILRLLVAAGLGMQILIPAFSEEVAKVGALGIGILTAARGVGMIAGPFAGRLLSTRGHVGERKISALGVILAGVGYGLLVPAMRLPLGYAFVSIALGYAGLGAVEVMTTVIIQRRCPDSSLGTVVAIDNGIGAILKVIVVLAIGEIVTATTFAPIALVGGAILVLSGLVWYAVVPRAGSAGGSSSGSAQSPEA